MVKTDNYEEYMMLYADNELTADEVNELFAFVAAHPGMEQELKLYTATRLQPDTNIVFEAKKTLLQPETPARKRIALGWRQYGIAAGVLLLLGLTIFRFAFDTKQTSDVSVAPVKQPIPQYAAKASSGPFDDSLVHRRNNVFKATIRKATATRPQRSNNNNLASGVAVNIPTTAPAESLPVAGLRTMPVTVQHYETDIIAVANPVHISAGDNYKKSRLIPEEKVEGFAERIGDVKSFANNIKGTAFVFNLSKSSSK